MRLNLAGRQWPLYIYNRVDFAALNATDDDVFGIISLPPGAFLLTDLHAIVEESVVGPSTAELVFTNDATAAAIITTDLLGAPGTQVVTVAGYYPEGIRIRVTVNKVGPVATAGVLRVIGSYVIDGRATETQTDVRPL